MIDVKVQHDEALGAYTFRFVYRKHQWDDVKGIVNILKVLIPASDREYNPATKEWTILEASWPKLKTILQAGKFRITEEQVISNENFHYDYSTPIATVVSKDTLATQLVKLLEISKDDLSDSITLKKAYRRKALEWHPDRNNGDGTKMSELNSIWSAYNG